MNDATILEVELMNHDAEVLDPQSRAIANFREEILLWIDTALVRLREREQEESLATEKRSARAASTRSGMERGSQTRSPPSRPGARLGGAVLEPVMRSERSRNTTEEIAGPNSLGDPSRPPIATPGPETRPESKSPPLDSLKRLDALARLLDQRLKVSQEAASDSSGASGEGGGSNVQR